MGNLAQWQFDAPSGVWKSQYQSSELRKAAIAQTLFMPYVKVETGYGKRMGETIMIPRRSVLALPTNGQLDEQTGIPVDKLSFSTKSITVQEWGRAVEFSNKFADLSKVAIPEAQKESLQEQMALVMDRAAADAFQEAQVKYIPTGVASGVFDTDGTASTTASNVMNFFHVEQIRDYLFGTLKAPAYIDGDYIGIFAVKSVRGIKDDPKFEEWNKYTNREAKLKGEVGKIEGVRIIECNNFDSLSNTLGTGSVLGEGVVFGQDATFMAIAEDPELRMAQPADFGRKLAVAWYGILNFGIIWDTANAGEGRIIHVTSA